MKFYAYENGYEIDIDEKEKQGYIDYVQKKNPGQQIKYITVKLDGDYVDLKYEVVPIPFERIRRITGYLSEVKEFNDAKQDELKDRVKHG